LEKLSYEHPTPILRSGGLFAVLSFLDFFSQGVKRSAVATASNICRNVPIEAFDAITPAIPILTTLLSDPDQKGIIYY
jgi:E3 ubiquitin-protein ligase TRIP12